MASFTAKQSTPFLLEKCLFILNKKGAIRVVPDTDHPFFPKKKKFFFLGFQKGPDPRKRGISVSFCALGAGKEGVVPGEGTTRMTLRGATNCVCDGRKHAKNGGIVECGVSDGHTTSATGPRDSEDSEVNKMNPEL